MIIFDYIFPNKRLLDLSKHCYIFPGEVDLLL